MIFQKKITNVKYFTGTVGLNIRILKLVHENTLNVLLKICSAVVVVHNILILIARSKKQMEKLLVN